MRTSQIHRNPTKVADGGSRAGSLAPAFSIVLAKFLLY
jgi:hypothetical protein